MTKDGAWRTGTIGWCPRSEDCKNLHCLCDRCFRYSDYEKEEEKNEQQNP